MGIEWNHIFQVCNYSSYNFILIKKCFFFSHYNFSPVNDLIDRGNFTLEELLEEDELIQEVKAKNDRLTEL